jgi:BMFP domain-containing protein YqiC
VVADEGRDSAEVGSPRVETDTEAEAFSRSRLDYVLRKAFEAQREVFARCCWICGAAHLSLEALDAHRDDAHEDPGGNGP